MPRDEMEVRSDWAHPRLVEEEGKAFLKLFNTRTGEDYLCPLSWEQLLILNADSARLALRVALHKR